MILIDTTVWVEHLRGREDRLNSLIARQQVLMHPYVLGEVAMGSLKDRATLLWRLSILPMAPLVRDSDVLLLVETAKLYATGLSFIDAHLVASARLLPGCSFWCLDKRLHAAADRLGVAYAP